MAKGIDTKIPGMSTSWEGYQFNRIEEFIKEQISANNSKAGYWCISNTTDESSFYHLWGYATKAEYDSDAEANILFDIPIPISTVQGDSYAAYLYTSADSKKNFVISGSTLMVPLRFCSVQISSGERVNYGAKGTIRIERNSNGTWVEAATLNNALNSVNYADTNDYTSINIGPYLTSGKQEVRIRASYQYTDSEGLVKTVTSAYVTVGASVTKTVLGIECIQDYSSPLIQSTYGSQFPPIKFNVSGECKKYLHIEISGSTQVSTYTNVIELTDVEGVYTLSGIQDTSLIGLTKHGVHTIKAYLSCDDGSGHVGTDQHPDGIVSDASVSRFMIINDSATQIELNKVYLMMQGTASSADNYTNVHLTDFAIWKSSASDKAAADTGTHDIRIIVTDPAETDTSYTELYGEINFIGAKCLEKYSADCMIEIEGTGTAAHMRILRKTGTDTYENMIGTSGLLSTSFVGLSVVNNEDYVPATGATFYMNPKSRSNNEDEWDKIKNARSNNAIVATTANVSRTHSMWQKDDDGIGVLRVLAGESVEITGEAADAFFSLFGNGKSDISIEIDYKVKNITNENDPIIRMTEDYAGQTLGLVLNPQEITMMCNGKQNKETQSVGLREDVRTNIIVTLNHEVDPKDDDLSQYDLKASVDPKFSYEKLSLCRTYINGKCNNAFKYSTENKTWQKTSHGTRFIIGCDSADIDIYAIRFYPDALTPQQIKHNVTASKPTIEQKKRIVDDNKIVDANGRIKKNLVENNLKRNTFTLHSATEQWKGTESVKQNCYIEMHIYDPKTGAELLDRGGVIGKYAYLAYLNDELGGKKCFTWKSQGSTANTYFMHNGQGKVGDITYIVTIATRLLHSDFGWKVADSNFTEDKAAKYPLFYNDEQIQGGAYSSLTEAQKNECTIQVPDGWFDWNGMYHGQFWIPSTGGAKAQKLCNKINYASSMVSHKMGMTSLYNDVMRKILDAKNMLPKSHKSNASARFAVEELPFFYFHQGDEEGSAVFHGFSTFGSAKADKPTWGYDKSYSKMCMFEGADNNAPLADFRVPFDNDIHGYYNATKGDWSWAIDNKTENKAHELQLDFDLGITAGDKDSTLVEEVDKSAPWSEITAHLRQFCNLFYTHNTRLNYWRGTIASLRQSYNALSDKDKRAMEKKTYWCTADFCLYRFNFTTLEWVDAGNWNDATGGNGYYSQGVRNLSTNSMTRAAYDAWVNEGTYDYGALNKLFRKAIASHFTSIATDYISVDSMLTHYNLINAFGAGTDNCSKNTYFVLCLVTINGQDVWRWYWFTDDVDTIFKTDNNGGQTKAWWIFRMSDVQDVENGYKEKTDYEGNNSVMFNLIEDAYDDNIDREDGVSGTADTQLQSNMASVLAAMQSLVSSSDSIEGYTAESSVMACLHKYFLQYSEYFPMLAFNETGRIRYEYPEAWGYISTGDGARSVAPITQHTGDQREAEIDFLEKRSVLFAQYACWGEAAALTGGTGVVGASQMVSFKGNSTLGQLTLDFEVKSDRPFFPTGSSGNSHINPHVRVMPGQSYTIRISSNGDQGCGLCCSNYYTEIGNIGSALISSQATSIIATRLRKLELTSTDPQSFGTSELTIGCNNIESLRLGTPGYKSSLDLSKCLRLKSVDISGSETNMVTLPTDTQLNTVKYNNKIVDVTLKDLPYLKTFSAQSYEKLMAVYVDNVPYLDSLSLMQGIYAGNHTALKDVTLYGINWQDESNVPPPQMVYWMCSLGANITGIIDCSKATGTFSFEQKWNLVMKYGDIDSDSNGLRIKYKTINITGVSISGKKYIDQSMCSSNSDDSFKYDGLALSVLPATGNSFAIKDGKPDVTWSLPSNHYASVANAVTGELRIVSFSEQDVKYTIQASLKKTDGTTLSPSYVIGFYKRIPKLGDFAYLDGDFDDQYDSTKDLAGIVYARLWYQFDPDTVKTNNPILAYESVGGEYKIDSKAKYLKLFIVSKEYMSQKSTDGAATPISSSMAWGLYNDNSSGSNGFSTEEMSTILALINQRTGKNLTSMFDLAELSNITSTGLYNAAGNQVDRAYADNIQADMTDEADYKNGGFRAKNTPAGCVTGTAMDQWNGKENTQKIADFVDTIISTWISENYSIMNPPKTLQELADYMYNVLYKTVGDGTKDKYYQFAYPAAYACHVYEPKASKGTVANQYKAGQWYLPAVGELTRLYHHFNISRQNPMTTTNTENNSNVPSATYYNYDTQKGREGMDAWNPIFAKAYKRIADAGGSASVLTNLSASYHWSSSEDSSTNAWYVNFFSSYVVSSSKYGGYSVRPVVAYTFEL